MENRLHINSSPHFHSNVTTRSIMLDVVIALIPALVAGVIFFGIEALILVFRMKIKPGNNRKMIQVC